MVSKTNASERAQTVNKKSLLSEQEASHMFRDKSVDHVT